MLTQTIRHRFWTGKRVLLTGHTGFKGSWLALWLNELGAQVTGVGLRPETKPNLFSQLQLTDQVEQHFIADIRNAEVLNEIVKTCQPQVVFHLAAQPLVRRSYRDPLGTWATNVQGSLHMLEALKPLQHNCAVVMVTTDKVYKNRNWDYGYRETDRLGGHDPYSASKAAAELLVASWRASFCGRLPHQNPHLAIATARSGNVIGGGDWAEDRIVPDAIRALVEDKPVTIRNPGATRPWQHVLEPLAGYLYLAKALFDGHSTEEDSNRYCSAFNFGPLHEANRCVEQLIEEGFKHWPGKWDSQSDRVSLHEAERLHLQIDKATRLLNWQPRWNFTTTIERTFKWYKAVNDGADPRQCCIDDLTFYQNQIRNLP